MSHENPSGNTYGPADLSHHAIFFTWIRLSIIISWPGCLVRLLLFVVFILLFVCLLNVPFVSPPKYKNANKKMFEKEKKEKKKGAFLFLPSPTPTASLYSRPLQSTFLATICPKALPFPPLFLNCLWRICPLIANNSSMPWLPTKGNITKVIHVIQLAH